jgi:hypothetical protein
MPAVSANHNLFTSCTPCMPPLCTQVYLAGASGPAENLALLDHMLAARHQLGTLLGFDSYAAFKAADGSLAGMYGDSD